MVRETTFDSESLSSHSSESGEFTVTTNPSPSPHVTLPSDLSSTRNPFVEQYLNIYYKKGLDASMILGTGQLVQNLLALYENLEDEAANCYILSFLLLRVGCLSKSYDFDDYLEMTRDEREKLIKDNWSGKKVLMKLSSKDEETEKNVKRFEAFFSALACLRYDDLLRLNAETNLKKLFTCLREDLHSSIIEHRYTVLLALSSLLRGLMTTVVHGRRNKPGKISPFLGQKDAKKIFEFISTVITESFLDRCSDSESEISELAYQSLIDLATIWPNSWLNKPLFDVFIYSIVAQEEKNDFHQSIVLFRRLLSHVDLEKESLRCWIHHLFVRLSSDRFELVSLTHTISIFKLINEILTIYPEMFSARLVFHWSTPIFQDNHRSQQLALQFFLRWIQINEEQFQSTTIWPFLIRLTRTIFHTRITEESLACLIHAIQNNRQISTILSNLSGIEAFLQKKRFDDRASNLIVLQLLRSLFIFHLNHQTQHLCQHLSRLTFDFVSQLIEEDLMEKHLLVESLATLQTTLCALPVEDSLSIAELIDELKMAVATDRLSETSIDDD